MRRKVIALLLSVCMLAVPLAGCGSHENADSENTSVVNGKETQTDRKAEEGGNTETIKLTGLYVSHSLTKDMNELQWLQELEAKANVDIEWEQIYSDWETTKSTRFASGDIPDILINATVDSDYTKYNGLFMELSQLIEENAPNVMQMFEEEPDTRILATTKEGKIFAAPKFQGKWPATNTVMFINKKWLDNLGLEMPETFTELEEVLKAFNCLLYTSPSPRD